MSGPPLRTVVADTSALVNLAVPQADPGYGTGTNPDPLQYLLTSCTVTVPPEVRNELHQLTQYQDIHSAAAQNVLAASGHYTETGPYQLADGPDSRPTVGLDDGETDGIVLANTLGVDGFLTDEFGSTNFALVHAALRGPRIVPTPRLICDYARNGHLSVPDAKALVQMISQHRNWANSPYVTQLLSQLD